LTEEVEHPESESASEDAAASDAPRDAAPAEEASAGSASASETAASAEPEPEAASEEAPAADDAPAVEPEPEPAAAEPEPVEVPPSAEEVSEQAPSDPATIQATAPQHAEVSEEVLEEVDDEAPRLKPEIPGADLIPDIAPEGDQFLDAEARAAAEADAEAAAAAAAEQSDDVSSQPIADAAIDLAAGARYTSTGKRKSAVARVILKPGTGAYTINGKTLDEFFPRPTLQRIIRQPLEAVGYDARMDVIARMHGGGVSAQAGALRHGISRALIVADPNLRGELKRRGFLTRDPRVKERKKAGLKKARKRPQFSKR
jgi:small subunit ribosomal protein S9